MQSQGNALLVDAGGCAVEVACAEPSHKAKRSCLGIRRIIMKRLSVIFASLLVSLCSVGAWARPDHEPPKRHAERDTSAIAENFRIGVDRTITVELPDGRVLSRPLRESSSRFAARSRNGP